MSKFVSGGISKEEAVRIMQGEGSDSVKRKLEMIERQIVRAENDRAKRNSQIMMNAYRRIVDEGNPLYFNALQFCNQMPVTIEEFIGSKDFLGDSVDIWPALKEDAYAMNPDIMIGEKPYTQVILGGATSTGKTTLAHLCNWYDVYFLQCFSRPQLIFPSLNQDITLVFMFQSVSQSVTRRAIYEPFKRTLLGMPYFRKYVSWDKNLESEIHFSNNVHVVQALANETSMLGQAIIGGILDEVNFMSVIENSSKAVGARGGGGKFDQAEIVYRTISRRRKSRFITQGPNPGKLCVLSSTRYKGDFLDRRFEEVRKNKEEGVFLSRRKQYEAQPWEGRFCGTTFRLLIGNEFYQTRVLGEEEIAGRDFPLTAMVEDVPVEYMSDFQSDPENALRDVLGMSTDTLSPFFTQRHKIIEAITRGHEINLQPWVFNQNVTLKDDGMPQIDEEKLPTDRDKPRFIHVDLSRTRDRCGIAIVKVLGHSVVEIKGARVSMPVLAVETAISIKPDKAHEIDLAEVREWITSLKTFYGINIRCVSYDGFDSKESIQLLNKAGIHAIYISMDKTNEPYENLRSAFYQNRIAMVDNELLRVELTGLEYHAEKDKVDHAPRMSKDIADAVAGACQSAAMSRVHRNSVQVTTDDGTSFQQLTMEQQRRNLRARRINRRRSPRNG